ncbi:MAG: hypothetical protein NZ750_08135 [Anaerolineae bacterium]|nr:hypothetical protein [Anaerolineae bacterium]MDW8172318.1 hypothetical protein [Anaerolineae bacterium]
MKLLRHLLALLLALTACVPQADPELETQAAFIGTQRAQLEASATVQTARLQTTLDYSGTRVSAAATQSQLLKATLIAMGTPPADLEAFQRQFMESRPSSTPDTAQSGPSPTTDRLAVTPPDLPSPTPTTGPRLVDIVMTERVGADDCPIGNSSVFSTRSEAIYVVARAVNAPRGTVFTSRWLLRNEEVIRYDFAPDFDIARACIWFYIDPNEVRFAPGPWAVVLQVNGQDAAPPVEFIIRE